MWFKKFLSMVMATICLCFGLSVSAYAEETDKYISYDISLAYEIVQNPTSLLYIKGTTASCQSYADSNNCVSITATHTLQKCSGWFWIWNEVENSIRHKTVNANSITLSTTHGGLKSGTYRLKSTFSLTDSSGEVETVTIYSSEVKI